MSRPKTLQVSLSDLAQMIDHSLLHPTMTDDEVYEGLQTCKQYKVKTGIPSSPSQNLQTYIDIS